MTSLARRLRVATVDGYHTTVSSVSRNVARYAKLPLRRDLGHRHVGVHALILEAVLESFAGL